MIFASVSYPFLSSGYSGEGLFSGVAALSGLG